jgi:hypothetical protein
MKARLAWPGSPLLADQGGSTTRSCIVTQHRRLDSRVFYTRHSDDRELLSAFLQHGEAKEMHRYFLPHVRPHVGTSNNCI